MRVYCSVLPVAKSDRVTSSERFLQRFRLTADTEWKVEMTTAVDNPLDYARSSLPGRTARGVYMLPKAHSANPQAWLPCL
jgi:hypothetical protein